MTDDEKAVLTYAVSVLERATCNSLDPVDRDRWSVDRAYTIEQLRQMSR